MAHPPKPVKIRIIGRKALLGLGDGYYTHLQTREMAADEYRYQYGHEPEGMVLTITNEDFDEWKCYPPKGD